MNAAWKNPWRIHFFKSSDGSVPGRDFLENCPTNVRATMVAALQAVADAPPPAFSGGGYWEAMHGNMAGYYEVRVNGPKRHHYRLFCLLERDEDNVLGLGGPSIVIITGKSKAFRTELKNSDYAAVRALGDECRGTVPRSVDGA